MSNVPSSDPGERDGAKKKLSAQGTSDMCKTEGLPGKRATPFCKDPSPAAAQDGLRAQEDGDRALGLELLGGLSKERHSHPLSPSQLCGKREARGFRYLKESKEGSG